MQVVFLAFANSQENSLPTLSREDAGVFSVLVNRSLKGHFFIHRDSFTTLENINEYLSRYRDQLALFLFSGHAGDETLRLIGGEANARGIAYQLGESARNGILKLVVLNGCSTAGQVKALLEAGVPAVVATSAPVGDHSATEFSTHFFRCLAEKRMTIRDAFDEALGPAQTSTRQELPVSEIARGLRLPDSSDSESPLWGLYTNNEADLDTNPLPGRKSKSSRFDFAPNEQLTDVLFGALAKAGNRDVLSLKEKEEEGEYVEIGDKQTAIVNVLPFPIGIHLQKLLCPVEQMNEGFDKVSRQRLQQIGNTYLRTVELMTFILLSQLWEAKLRGRMDALSPQLRSLLRDFFYLPTEKRRTFDHLPLIRAIRRFLDQLPDGKGNTYFIKELEELRRLLKEDHPFQRACAYLTYLRKQSLEDNGIEEVDIPELCEEAENSLSDFFSELGFLHRYTLASIQNIDLQKYRHQLTPKFNHETVKLMRAFGKPEHNYYLLPEFLDNRGVVLLKGKLRVIDPRKRQFAGEHLSFLNLSPFVVDRNAFEENADLANLLFYSSYLPGDKVYEFSNIKRPDSRADRLYIRAMEVFEAVFLQLEAFRTTILGDSE